MTWYYTSGGQQMGPVDEPRLHELFRSGAVPPGAMVWRDGMDSWKPYGEVFASSVPATRYGGFWMRFVSAVLDGIIVGVISSLAQMPFAFLMGGGAMMSPLALGRDPGPEFARAMMGMAGMSWLIGIAVAAAYHTLFVVNKGATPGKMVFGLKVVRADGQPIGAGLALGRYFATWLGWFTFCIGFIIAGFDEQKRALHDHICGTRVVRLPS